MLGLLFLTIGLRAGAGSAHPGMAARARRIVMAHPPATWLRLFLCTWIFGAVCVAMATQVPGLSQLLLAFAAMKWTGYFMLTYVTFLRPDVKRGPWLAIFLCE